MGNIYLTEIENTNIAGPRIAANSYEEAVEIAKDMNTTFGKIIVLGRLICEFEEYNLN